MVKDIQIGSIGHLGVRNFETLVERCKKLFIFQSYSFEDKDLARKTRVSKQI